MVVGVRKNMMLLFENKLSYTDDIQCCGGWCHERWISLMAYQTQPALLAGMFIVRDVFCEIWINCGYVWLRCCRIGDKCVVLFLKMWEIGVCSITKI